MAKFLAEATPHEQAAKFLRGLPTVDRQTFDRLPDEFKASAFLITGITAHDALQDVRDLLATVPEGADFEEVRAKVQAKLEPLMGGNSKAARARALIVSRFHVNRGYNLGTVMQLDNHTGAFPFRKRLTAGDDRVRDSHAALNGVILPALSPAWEFLTPPGPGFNCRCFIVGVTRRDAERTKAREEAEISAGDLDPAKRQFIEGPMLKQLEDSRIFTRGMSEQYNFSSLVTFNPRSLLMPVDDIRARYDADTFDDFQKWAEGTEISGGESLWDRLVADRPAGSAKPAAKTKPQPKPEPEPEPQPKSEPEPVPEPKPKLEPEPKQAAEDSPAADTAKPAKGTKESIAAAKYESKTPLSTQGVNKSYQLKNGETVVFKPAEEEAQASGMEGIPDGTQHKREVAAGVVAEALRVDLVPPVTMITHEGQTGSAMLLKEGFEPGMALGGSLVKLNLRPEDWDQWQLFDDVVNHLDRHNNNWLARKRPDSTFEVALIDNGHTNPVNYKDYGGKRFETGLEGDPLSDASRARLTDMLANEAAIRKQLAALLEPIAIDMLFERVRTLLKRGTYGDAVE